MSKLRHLAGQGGNRGDTCRSFWEAERSIRILERIPDGYTCHFVRPNWVLPSVERPSVSRHLRLRSDCLNRLCYRPAVSRADPACSGCLLSVRLRPRETKNRLDG